MGKIVRLSWANIRKHTLESISLLVLVMLCMVMIGSALGATIGIREIFPQVMGKTQSCENFIMILDRNYDPEYENIIKEKPQVERFSHSEMLYSMSTNYVNEQGMEQALYLAFITMENDAKFENPVIETTLTDEEIAAMEHPIYMPVTMHDSMGFREGDTFDMIYGTRKFTYTVAGFYETLVFDVVGGGVKMIVSESDYHILESVLPHYAVMTYDDHQGEGGEDLLNEILKDCENYSNRDITSSLIAGTYDGLEVGVTYSAEILLKLMIAMAFVIIISVAVMIRFRIAGDIREQIVNIGVLEALGYTSGEITLSYVVEYLMLAAGGVLIGIGGCFALTPVLLHIGEIVSAHRGSGSTAPLPILLTALVILVFVGLFAFIRARMVRKYPPVRAFRKGQGDHHFGKEHFPLRDTRQNVHLRLALKGFVQNFRQNLGLTVCIVIASVTSVFSFIIFTFFSGGMNAIAATAGMEMSDLRIDLMPYVDACAFAEELEEMPEIRKATPTSSLNTIITITDFNEMMLPMAFSSFDVTENIFPMEGRFPEHDNEIMVTNLCARTQKVSVGDSLTLEYLNVQKKYVVTGIVTSNTNGGINLYITEDGMKRLIPTYRPDLVEVYLEEGVDVNAFRSVLTDKYGRSLSDAAKDSDSSGSYEERIRAEAEQQIAELMAAYGASHIEYSIQLGDTVISGNSSGFVISSIMNVGDILRTQLSGTSLAVSLVTALFMGLSALVVMIILFILMESTIRRQRKEFGIMKGLGYTSRELMLQLAMRIMPAAVFAVVIGTGIGIAATDLLTSVIGKVSINIPLVILLDLCLLAFCFVCAFFGARKIKTISVYELMTE